MRERAVGLALAAVALAAGPARGQDAVPDSVVYGVALTSRLDVHTGTAGLFGGLAHEHLVRARAFRGSIVHVPDDPPRSSVTITIFSDSLDVLTAADSQDRAKITRVMRERTLAAERFPEITFVSREVTPIEGGLRVGGDLTLAGQTRRVTVDVAVEMAGDTLRATTRFPLKQTDFGIKPYGAALGTVKVKDEVELDLDVVGVRVR